LNYLENRVIIESDKNRIIFHGCRNLDTLLEETTEKFEKKYKWETPKKFEFKSLEEIIEESKKLNPLKQEGFIATDKYFNRIKIKW
jgi:hypothetical protein